MDLGLKGKKAIVVGATRGIGRAIASLLANEGCDAAICARDRGQVDATVAELKALGVFALGDTVDAGDGAALRGFIEKAAAAMGGLDVFVFNASAALYGANDEASWRVGFEVDLMGTVRGCEAALPFLEKSGSGAIVVVGTVSAVEVVGPRRAYSSVKAAVLPYIKSLAHNVAPRNVRCNVVSPGMVYFKGGVWEMIERNAPDRFRDAIARNPMGRLGTPDEIANAVVFMASPRASFISGANLICDGARTQRVQF